MGTYTVIEGGGQAASPTEKAEMFVWMERLDE